MAEAKEVLDKRAGRKPATNLDPIDFLDESAGQDEEALPQQQQHAWMRDPTDEEWQSASTASCLAWIRAAATASTTLVLAQTLLHIPATFQMTSIVCANERRHSQQASLHFLVQATSLCGALSLKAH